MTDLNMDEHLQLAIDLGYVRFPGPDRFIITKEGKALIEAELHKPENERLLHAIAHLKDQPDEQASMILGVLAGIIERQVNNDTAG